MAEEMTGDQRCIGRLHVTSSLVEEAPHAVAAAFEGGVVLRCEYVPHMRRYEYVLWHPDFKPVPDGEIPPLYQVDLQKDGDSPARRVRFLA